MDENTTPTTNNPTQSSLPEIRLTDRRLREITRDSLSALEKANHPPIYFVRGGSVTRFRTDEQDRPLLEGVNDAMMVGRLARVADYYALGANGIKIKRDPPLLVARDVLTLGSWRLPPILGIVEAPVLRPDGSIMMTPGYDPQTGLYYFPAPDFEMDAVPDTPTQEQALKAKELLFDIFQDFPFKDEASLANMLGLLLTPLVRPAFEGCTPLALIDAPQAGTGKTMLATIVGAISTGHDPTFLPYSADSEEMRKRITAALRTSASVISMDNVSTELNSEILASALTTTLWGDRLLGKNELLRLPQRATWIANGNNLRIGGDLPRRCYIIKLDAQMSQPWMRSGFHHPDLVEWVTSRRPELMWAAFVLVRVWVSAGKPNFSGKNLGGFSQWGNVMGGILETAQVKGFLANREFLYDAIDEEGSQWESFLLALQEHFQQEWFTTAQISEALLDAPALVDALPDELGSSFRYDGGTDNRFNQIMGIELRSRIHTRYGPSQMFIRHRKDSHLKIAQWQVVCGDAGTCGTSTLEFENQTMPVSEVSEKVPAFPAVPAQKKTKR